MNINLAFPTLLFVLILFQSSTVIAQELQSTLKQTNSVYGVFLSVQDSLIFTAGKDSTVKLWNLEGELVGLFNGHTSSVSSVDFDDDTRSVISGGYDNAAILWDISGDILQTFIGHENAVIDVIINKEFVASSGRDHLCIVWNKNGDILTRFEEHTGQVNNIYYSESTKKFYSGSDDGTLKSWDIEGELKQSIRFEAGIRSFEVIENNGIILVGLRNGYLEIIDMAGKKINKFKASESQINDIQMIEYTDLFAVTNSNLISI